tara:strand:- start:764 stop:1027 length:264 start_codon:yes stop_codon:yes gene_type:complete
MPNQRAIKDTVYEIVSEFYDNGESSSLAKTIVDEGDGVNTYRIIVASHNPLTREPFNKDADKLWAYLRGNESDLWRTYWDDPDEGGE